MPTTTEARTAPAHLFFAFAILSVGVFLLFPSMASAQTGTISGCVFEDVNANGQLDGAESYAPPAQESIQFRLRGVDINTFGYKQDVVVSHSSGDGCYQFTAVPAGELQIAANIKGEGTFGPYNTFVGHLGGMRWHTAKDVGDDATDNDFGDASSFLLPKTMARTDVFVHDGTSAMVNVDLGYVISPILTSRVSLDVPGNGLAGVEVRLKDSGSGDLLYSTSTRSDGWWQMGEFKNKAVSHLIADMQPGDVEIEYVVPAGVSGAPTGNFLSLDSNSSFETTQLAEVVLTSDPFPGAGSCGGVGGTAYRDDNANGRRDPGEPGVAQLAVEVHDDAGTLVGQGTTDSSGLYSIAIAAAGQVRVQFPALTMGADGPAGSGSGSSVQFAAVPACGLDVAVSAPTSYCQSEPRLLTSCLVRSAADQSLAALVDVPWLISDEDPPSLQGALHNYAASAADVGSVFGLAYHSAEKTILAGAYVRAGADVGPAGAEAIYAVEYDSGMVTTLVDLGGTGPTGSVPAGSGLVGKTGLGDIELSADQETLWAVHLENRTLVEIPLQIVVGALQAQTPIAYSHPVPNNCPATDVRPFALTVHPDTSQQTVYVGSVCSAETSLQTADLRVYVYQFEPGTEQWTEVLNDDLAYFHDGLNVDEWKAWDTAIHEPMLVDLEFTGDVLALALRDRAGDQSIADSYYPGDLLVACPDGNGAFILENGTTCGASPFADEFYFGDADWAALDESHSGGLASRPALGEIVTTATDNNLNPSNGFAWYSPLTGARTRDYDIYASSTNQFGKAPGTGDVELLCDAAPLEIGNRIWSDDGNGVQDAGEPGIAGVVVVLLTADGTFLAFTTTDVEGNYAFVSESSPRASDPGVGIVVGDIQPATDYVVEIPPLNFIPGLALEGRAATAANSAGNDEIDSDGVTVAVQSFSVFGAAVTTGGVGANDHSVDFGFTEPAPSDETDLSIEKIDSKDPVYLNETFFYTITIRNLGSQPALDVSYVDTLPAELLYIDGAGCSANGQAITCSIGDIAAGGVVTHNLLVTVVAEAASVENTVTVAFDGTDTNPANDTATETTAMVQAGTKVVSVTGPSGRALDPCNPLTRQPTFLDIGFGEPMNNPNGDTDPSDVTNLANYLVIEAGPDGVLDTASCGAVQNDDVAVTLSHVTTAQADTSAKLHFDRRLGNGRYRLILCDSLTSATGDVLDGDCDGQAGGDYSIDFVVDTMNSLSDPAAICNNGGWQSNVAHAQMSTVEGSDAGLPELDSVLQIELEAGADASLSQCLAVEPGSVWLTFQSRFRSAQSGPEARLSCQVYDGLSCTGNPLESFSDEVGELGPADWRHGQTSFKLPEGALSAACSLGVGKPVPTGRSHNRLPDTQVWMTSMRATFSLLAVDFELGLAEFGNQ